MSLGFNNVYTQACLDRNTFETELDFFPEARELDCCIIDSNSAARNSSSAAKGVFSLPAFATTAINVSAAVGGILGVPIGLAGARDGYLKAKYAFKVGDREGVGTNILWGSFGAGFGGVSGILGTEGIMGLAGTAIPATLGTAFGGVGLGMNGALALYGAYALNEARKFGDELTKRSPEEAFEWLREQISLTADEIQECRQCEEPDKEMARRLQKKWNALELRVGSACAKKLREALFEKIENLAELIEEVEKANFKQQVKYVLFIMIALVGTAAFVAMMLSTGPASPAFFALGALLWLTVDNSKLHSYIGEKCWTWHRGDKNPELQPCPDPLAS